MDEQEQELKPEVQVVDYVGGKVIVPLNDVGLQIEDYIGAGLDKDESVRMILWNDIVSHFIIDETETIVAIEW
jgi:hypothetical protein